MGPTPFIPESIVLYVCSTYCPLLCIILDVILIGKQPHEVRGSTPSRRTCYHGLHEVNTDPGLLKEAGLLSISDQGDIAAARLRERALRDRQCTLVAQAAQRTEGPTVRSEVTRNTRSQEQGQRQHSRCSWRVAAEAV